MVSWCDMCYFNYWRTLLNKMPWGGSHRGGSEMQEILQEVCRENLRWSTGWCTPENRISQGKYLHLWHLKRKTIRWPCGTLRETNTDSTKSISQVQKLIIYPIWERQTVSFQESIWIYIFIGYYLIFMTIIDYHVWWYISSNQTTRVVRPLWVPRCPRLDTVAVMPDDAEFDEVAACRFTKLIDKLIPIWGS